MSDPARDIIQDFRQLEAAGSFQPDGYFRTNTFATTLPEPVDELGLSPTATWTATVYDATVPKDDPYPGDGYSRVWCIRMMEKVS